MAEYRISYCEHTEAFGNYRFDVLRNDQKVAEIEHNYRGEDHCLRKPQGKWIETGRIIEGGGPKPLRLSVTGLKVLEQMLSEP